MHVKWLYRDILLVCPLKQCPSDRRECRGSSRGSRIEFAGFSIGSGRNGSSNTRDRRVLPGEDLPGRDLLVL